MLSSMLSSINYNLFHHSLVSITALNPQLSALYARIGSSVTHQNFHHNANADISQKFFHRRKIWGRSFVLFQGNLESRQLPFGRTFDAVSNAHSSLIPFLYASKSIFNLRNYDSNYWNFIMNTNILYRNPAFLCLDKIQMGILPTFLQNLK